MRTLRFKLRSAVAISITGSLLATSLMGVALANTDWYVLKAKNKPVGFVRVDNFEDASGQVTRIQNINPMTRLGEPFDSGFYSTFIEHAGKPIRFQHQVRVANQDSARTEGEVAGDELTVQLVSHSEAVSASTPITGDKFVFPESATLRKKFSAHYHDPPGTRFDYQTLHLAMAPQLVHAQVILENRETFQASERPERALRKFVIQNPANANSTVYEWRDQDGKLYKAVSPATGTELVYASEQAVEKLGASVSKDVFTSSQVATNWVAYPRQTYTTLLKISPLDGNISALKAKFPENSWQTITQSTPESIFMRIHQKMPVNVEIKFPIPFDQIYLKNSPYLQVNDPDMIRIAKEVTEGEDRAFFAARKLQQWVHQHIQRKNYTSGFASAKETLDARSGDCTEHAVLLAALTRAIGIPSRVAAGLVYEPKIRDEYGSFVYHMWTEVYIGDDRGGEWIPFDASNPEEQMDATHIKVVDSPLSSINDPVQLSEKVAALIGNLKIEVVEALAPGTSNLRFSNQGQIPTLEIPKIDITRLDIRQSSQENIHRFSMTPKPVDLSEQSPKGLFTKGVEALSEGRYEQAEAHFREAAAKSEHPRDLFQLSTQLVALELFSLSNSLMQQAINQDASLSEQAQSWLNEYFPKTLLPSHLEKAYVMTVHGQISGGNPEAAQHQYMDIIQSAPQFAPAYLRLAEIKTNQQEYDQALDLYERFLALRPQDPRGIEGKAQVYFQQQRYSEATALYKDALYLARQKSAPPFQNRATWLSAQAELSQALGSLAQNENNPQAWVALGQALEKQDKPTEALKAFQNASLLGSTEGKVHQFAQLLRQSEITLLRPAYETGFLPAGGALGWHLQGLYEIKTFQYDKAEQSLQQAIQMAPHDPAIYKSLADLYQRQRKQDAAVQTLKEGLSMASDHPDSDSLRYQLAELLMFTAPEEALSLLEPLLHQHGHDPKLHTLIGQAHFFMDNPTQAKTALDTAISLDSNASEAYKLLGDLYASMNNPSDALLYYKQALKVNPAYTDANNALHQLIADQNLPFKQPPLVDTLSEAERDYFTFYVKTREEMAEQDIELYQRWLPHVKSIAGFSPSQNQSRKIVRDLLDKRLQQSLTTYKALQAITPPKRFENLHYILSATTHAEIERNQFWKDNMPYLSPVTNPELVTIHQAKNQQLLEKMERLIKLDESEGKKIRNSLSPQTVRELVLSSGYIEYSQKLNEVLSLQIELLKEMLTLNNPKKAPATTGTAPGTGEDLPSLEELQKHLKQGMR